MAEFIFWLCLLLPVYAWVGYPLLLTLLAPLFRVRRHAPAQPMNVSIIIAAHNEARHVEEKLRTLLTQDYQARSLHIILASDGSTDDTVACARKVIDPRISVLDLPRQGNAGIQGGCLTLTRQVEHADARVDDLVGAGHGVVGGAVAGQNDL